VRDVLEFTTISKDLAGCRPPFQSLVSKHLGRHRFCAGDAAAARKGLRATAGVLERARRLVKAYLKAGRQGNAIQLYEKRAGLLPDHLEAAPGWRRLPGSGWSEGPGRSRDRLGAGQRLNPLEPRVQELLPLVLEAAGDHQSAGSHAAREARRATTADTGVGSPARERSSRVRSAGRWQVLWHSCERTGSRGNREWLRKSRELLLQCGQAGRALELLHDERRAFGGVDLAPAYAAVGQQLSKWPIDFTRAREAAQAALSIDSEQSAAQELLQRLDKIAGGWADEVQGHPGRRARRANARERYSSVRSLVRPSIHPSQGAPLNRLIARA